MASIATIGLAEGEDRVIKIEPGKTAQKTFTVTNIFGGQLRMGFKCQFDKTEQRDWAKPRGAVERDLGAQASEQITLDIAPPKTAAPGKYSFKLLAYSLKDPDLNFTLSDPITIEIPVPQAQPVVVEKKKIWPWILLAVGIVLIVGGILTWVILSSGEKQPDTPTPPPTQPDKPPVTETKNECPFGVDQCLQGFVWREAYAGDHVCVTPDIRAQAAADNRAAASRRSPTGGAFGPDTCKQGFVWREASPTDHVCVTGATRDQARRDNAAAASRRDPKCAPKFHLMLDRPIRKEMLLRDAPEEGAGK